MDFTKTIKSEMEEKYKSMLENSSDAPFSCLIKISSASKYDEKRKSYYKRLNDEQSSFNNALQQVRDNRNARLQRERDNATKRAQTKFNCWKAIKVCIFLLPIVFCVLIGYDVFNPHGQMNKIEAMDNFSVGWAIAIYVIFSLLSTICSIRFILKMCRNDIFEAGIKKYNVLAICLLICYMAFAGTNLYFVFTNSDKFKLTFMGGDAAEVEYVDKGDSIFLPSECVKADLQTENYVTRYTFTGWDINGIIYRPGDEFEPTGNETICAVFSETNYGHFTVSGKNCTVSQHIIYNNAEYTLSNWKDDYIPLGATVTLSIAFSYSGEQTFTVNGVSVSNPYTFTMEQHTTVYVSCEDTNCLVEGTTILLSDGTKKAVESLDAGDRLIAFNHETGCYEDAMLLANVHANEDANWYNVLNLHFSNGQILRIVGEHGLFDKTLNRYVYIKEKNAQEFLGHTFVSVDIIDGEITNRFVTLDAVYVSNEYVKIYNPASVWHINVVANNLLTLSAGMVNLFEYDDDMRYNSDAMEQEIEQYGLYAYEDFKDYVSREVFDMFPFMYYKVAVEKGEFAFDQILALIGFYYDEDSIRQYG